MDVASTLGKGPSTARVAGWARELMAGAPGARGRGVSILLCGDARMRSVNRAWRREDRPTDVLSFRSTSPGYLGDILIDVPYAARQARLRGHGLDRELQVLLAHGLLHLLGHDHETDDGEMFRLQKRTVRRVFGDGPDGVPDPVR